MKISMPLGFAIASLITMALSAQSSRFVVAIVRPDGAIVPFAAYAAGRWQSAWPQADEEVVRPPSIEAAPSVWRRRGERVPRVWHVWPGSNGALFPARVTGIDVVDAGCLSQLALTSNLSRFDPPDGLASRVALDSATVPVTAVEPVPQSDALWATSERTVRRSFSRLESAQATVSMEPLPRETPPPVARLTALYREAGTPRSPLYCIAEKRYRTARLPQDPQCHTRTILTGWLLPVSADAYGLVAPKAFVTDCDEVSARKGMPLAALKMSGRSWWVLLEHGYEDEMYLMVDIRQQDVRYPVAVSGGGC